MLKFMLDTNICIFYDKEQTRQCQGTFNLNRGENYISSVTLMELIYGAEKARCLNVISL